MALELMHLCTHSLPSFAADSLNKDGEHRKYSGEFPLTYEWGVLGFSSNNRRPVGPFFDFLLW
jgi:hypothetical protein